MLRNRRRMGSKSANDEEASQILQSALQQMDEILANANFDFSTNGFEVTAAETASVKVSMVAEELRLAMETAMSENGNEWCAEISEETHQFLLCCLQKSHNHLQQNGGLSSTSSSQLGGSTSSLNQHVPTSAKAETQAMKREAEAMPGYVPLNSSTKVKVKRGIFGHKRSRSQSDIDNLICPMDSTSSLDQPPSTNGSVSNGSVSNGGVSNGAVSNGGVANGGLSNGAVHNGAVANGNGIHHDEEQNEHEENGTATEVCAFSDGLSSLTSRLTQDQFRNVPQSVV